VLRQGRTFCAAGSPPGSAPARWPIVISRAPAGGPARPGIADPAGPPAAGACGGSSAGATSCGRPPPARQGLYITAPVTGCQVDWPVSLAPRAARLPGAEHAAMAWPGQTQRIWLGPGRAGAAAGYAGERAPTGRAARARRARDACPPQPSPGRAAGRAACGGAPRRAAHRSPGPGGQRAGRGARLQEGRRLGALHLAQAPRRAAQVPLQRRRQDGRGARVLLRAGTWQDMTGCMQVSPPLGSRPSSSFTQRGKRRAGGEQGRRSGRRAG